jgi:aminoglycoside 6'-N-acetyltransferase I
MRCALWAEGSPSEHAGEIAAYFEGRGRERVAVLIAEDGSGCPLGFAELSVRPYAEGCRSDGVAYLEGLYVVPEARRRGVARALIAAAEEWGRGQGCTEFASDAELMNDVSATAHRALGFTEVARLRCFRKDL